jgi:hypothetical protein
MNVEFLLTLWLMLLQKKITNMEEWVMKGTKQDWSAFLMGQEGPCYYQCKYIIAELGIYIALKKINVSQLLYVGSKWMGILARIL